MEQTCAPAHLRLAGIYSYHETCEQTEYSWMGFKRGLMISFLHKSIPYCIIKCVKMLHSLIHK